MSAPLAALVASNPGDLAMVTPVAAASRRAGFAIATPLAFAKAKRQIERAGQTGAALLVIVDGAATTIVNRLTGARREVTTASAGDELAGILRSMRAAVTFGA